jgi:predicted permease
MARQFRTLKFSVHDARNGVSPLRARFEDPLWLLFAIAALVLLTACANVTNLFLVRATARAPELALRVALGASRPRIIRQLLIEGALIAVAGAAAGLVLARVADAAVMHLLSTRTDPIVLDVGIDWRTLGFNALTVCLTTVAFALAPAIRATRHAQIAASGRVSAGRDRVVMRELLVAVQVAMSVVLLSSATLFLLTLRNLASVNAGFSAADVLVANVFLNDQNYPRQMRSTVQRDLTARLAAIPGIESAAHTTTPPLSGSFWDTVVRVITPQGEVEAETNRNQISADYFRVMRTPVIAGREFNDRDTPSSPKVAIVNETFARKALGEPMPLGRRVADGAQEYEVVGVVGDSKQYTLREEFRPIVYTAASQVAEPGLTVRFVLRSRIGMTPTVESVRQAIAAFDRTAGVRFATLEDMTVDSLQGERLMANLSGFFGFIAVVLAAAGIAGVVSYTAASRRREIGIRIALGARGSDVMRALMARVALVIGAGLMLGLGLAIPVNAAASSLLYGIDPREPWTIALIAVLIVGSGLLAAFVPARRALRTDPVTALRAE